MNTDNSTIPASKRGSLKGGPLSRRGGFTFGSVNPCSRVSICGFITEHIRLSRLRAVGLGLLAWLGMATCVSWAQSVYTPYTFTTLAGIAGAGSADGTGSAARFNFPGCAAVDGSGNVYVADAANQTIRKITPSGVVTTLAGLAGSSGSADGTGSAARFNLPFGVAVDGSGSVYVADTYNHTIRQITPGGVVTTLAGLAGSSGSADGTGSG